MGRKEEKTDVLVGNLGKYVRFYLGRREEVVSWDRVLDGLYFEGQQSGLVDFGTFFDCLRFCCCVCVVVVLLLCWCVGV